MIDLSDFNVPPGTIIYGYSIFSNDTTNGGSMANLANWSNATYYPTAGARASIWLPSTACNLKTMSPSLRLTV